MQFFLECVSEVVFTISLYSASQVVITPKKTVFRGPIVPDFCERPETIETDFKWDHSIYLFNLHFYYNKKYNNNYYYPRQVQGRQHDGAQAQGDQVRGRGEHGALSPPEGREHRVRRVLFLSKSEKCLFIDRLFCILPDYLFAHTFRSVF